MKTFLVTPKRYKQALGIVISPTMTVTLVSRCNGYQPYFDEVRDRYLYLMQIDIKKLCLNIGDFTYTKL